jgi:hypothetical protein
VCSSDLANAESFTLIINATAAPTSVPTLGEWGFLILVSLMSLIGLAKLAQARKR